MPLSPSSITWNQSLAGKVTAGLVESNDGLVPGGSLKVTCGRTACIPGSALGPALGNEYGRTLPLPSPWCFVDSVVLTLLHDNGE